jgi:hypothetical protein
LTFKEEIFVLKLLSDEDGKLSYEILPGFVINGKNFMDAKLSYDETLLGVCSDSG